MQSQFYSGIWVYVHIKELLHKQGENKNIQNSIEKHLTISDWFYSINSGYYLLYTKNVTNPSMHFLCHHWSKYTQMFEWNCESVSVTFPDTPIEQLIWKNIWSCLLLNLHFAISVRNAHMFSKCVCVSVGITCQIEHFLIVHGNVAVKQL